LRQRSHRFGPRVLDLKEAAVRDAIGAADDAEALYLSGVASDYV